MTCRLTYIATTKKQPIVSCETNHWEPKYRYVILAAVKLSCPNSLPDQKSQTPSTFSNQKLLSSWALEHPPKNTSSNFAFCVLWCVCVKS